MGRERCDAFFKADIRKRSVIGQKRGIPGLNSLWAKRSSGGIWVGEVEVVRTGKDLKFSLCHLIQSTIVIFMLSM